MHIVSDQSLQRPGYIYNERGVGYPADSEPYIKWKHIDGPLLVCRDGQMHWLTWRQRFSMWVGWRDIYDLEREIMYSPQRF